MALSTSSEAASIVCAEAAGLRYAACDFAQSGDDFLGAGRGAGDVMGNLARRRFLLLDRNGDRAGIAVDVLHALGDFADRSDRFAARRLHRQNLVRDLFGRLGGLHRERFHFRGDHGKTATGFAGTCRLDSGVKREQIGLAGDVLDELDHIADLLRHVRQRGDVLVGRGGVGGGAAHHVIGLAELPADFPDRDRELGGGRSRGFDIGRRLVGAVHGALGALQRMVRRRQQRLCRRLHRARALADGFEHGLDPGAERGDRGIGRAAPLVALAQRVALLLGEQLVGDVGMRRYPAAAMHRAADDGDDPAVLELRRLRFGAPFGHSLEAVVDIAVDIAGEIARFKPVHQQIVQRRAWARMLGPQVGTSRYSDRCTAPGAPRRRTCTGLGSCC